MQNFNPATMIKLNDAKQYAMNRRFEVKPENRVRVFRYYEGNKIVPSAENEETSIDAFNAWDKDAINMIGDKGAACFVFDRKAFNDLFSKYPNK